MPTAPGPRLSASQHSTSRPLQRSSLCPLRAAIYPAMTILSILSFLLMRVCVLCLPPPLGRVGARYPAHGCATMPGPAAPAPRGSRSQPSAPSKQRARKSPARARGASPARAPSAPKARRTSPARVQARAATPERAPSAPRKRTRASPASKRPPSAAAPAAAAPAAKRRQAPKQPDPAQACRYSPECIARLHIGLRGRVHCMMGKLE